MEKKSFTFYRKTIILLLSNENNVNFSTDILDFQKNSLVKLTKLQISKK